MRHITNPSIKKALPHYIWQNFHKPADGNTRTYTRQSSTEGDGTLCSLLMQYEVSRDAGHGEKSKGFTLDRIRKHRQHRYRLWNAIFRKLPTFLASAISQDVIHCTQPHYSGWSWIWYPIQQNARLISWLEHNFCWPLPCHCDMYYLLKQSWSARAWYISR